MFYEAPAWLDGAEIGRIRRQENELRALCFDELPDHGRVVRTQVVEHDDITGVKTSTEPPANEFDEARPVDGTDERLMAEHAIAAHGTDDGEILAPVRGLVIVNASATRSPSVRRSHGDVASRLVDEDEAGRIFFRHQRDEGVAAFLDLRTILLGRSEPFFFQVSPALSRARCMAERLKLHLKPLASIVQA